MLISELKKNLQKPRSKFLFSSFIQDDANNDPQWSDEQIIAVKFDLNGVLIGRDEVDIMRKTTIAVFEMLEKYWATQDCVLVDMKIEFGISTKGKHVKMKPRPDRDYEFTGQTCVVNNKLQNKLHNR